MKKPSRFIQNALSAALISTCAVSGMLVTSGAMAAGTLDKIKSTSSATMGVRESSGALSYTIGDGRFAG